MQTSYASGMAEWLNRGSCGYFSLTCDNKDNPICRRMLALTLKSRRASASKQQVTIDRAENSSKQLESRSRAHGITEKKTGELLFFFRKSVLPVCFGPCFKRQGNVYCESDEREHPQMTMCPARCRGRQAKEQPCLSLWPLYSQAAARDFNLLNHTWS